MQNTISELKQLIHDQLGIDAATLDIDKPIAEYGLDSLAMIELIFLVEEHFGVDFPDATPDISTLSGLAGFVDKLRLVPA